MKVLDFCSKDGCGRLLSSPEEFARDTCRYCIRGVEANTATFFETFKATMSYAVQSLQPNLKLNLTKRTTKPEAPQPDTVTWEEAKGIGGMACTKMVKGIIKVNYELIAKNATYHSKETGDDLTEFLPQYIAEIQLHELIHAVGQIDHTAKQLYKRPQVTNKVFSQVTNAMGHSIWAKGWGLVNAKPPCPVIELDTEPAEVNTNPTTPRRTLFKPPLPVGVDMDANSTPPTDGLDAISRAYLEGGRLTSERAKTGSY